MHVSKLVVKGYRSLANVEVCFNPGINVIVGKNNAGKSNIIRALNLILGERHPLYVRFGNRDFHNDGSNSADELIIAVRLDGSFEAEIPPGRRIKVLELDSSFTPSWDEDCIEILTDESLSVKNAYKYPSEVLKDIKNSTEKWIFLHTKRGDSTNNHGLIYKKNGDWCKIPLRNEIRDLLITTAYVPSYRDPEKMLKITEYSWYGKLIKQIYEKGLRVHEREIRKIQKQHSDKINEIFHEASEELRKRLGRAIFHHKISFKPGPYTKDDEHKSITLFVNDGLDTPYYDKGSGIQSALVIALFTYYCECFHKGSSLLLLEEPENYLHPQGRRALEGELLRFVKENGNGERQIILSTHSPEFLRSVNLTSLVRVHKKLGSTASEIHQIKNVDDDTRRKFRQIMMKKSAEMFFADGVILVEGGEEYIIPQLFDVFARETRWLDSFNVSAIRVDGKGFFKIYTNILSKFNIWWKILTDLDFIYSGIKDFSDFLSDEDILLIDKISSEVNTYVNEYIKDLSDENQKKREKRKRRKEKLQMIVSENQNVGELIDKLKEHGIFILKRGELEDYFTDEAKNLDRRKDRRALEIALRIGGLDEFDLNRWFVDIDEFKNLFEAVKSRIVNAVGGEYVD